MDARFFKNIALSGLFFTLFFAGVKAENIEGTALPAFVVNGEPLPYVFLHEVFVFPELVFKNRRQEEFYWRTVRDVKRTLPYAQIAGRVLRETEEELRAIPTDRERRAFLKEKERELFSEFEGDIRRMTASQGRMLLLLIDRECNKSGFEIIRMYRGGVSAVFWQGVARIFGSNLKSTFDGEGNERDRIIERVITLVEAGQL